MNDMSVFAHGIMMKRYAQSGETSWQDIATRVVKSVVSDTRLHKDLIEAVVQRKFIPGGRYLYAAGRPYHQVQNCLLLKAEDTREGWAELAHNVTSALMSGAGIGVDYSAVRPEGSSLSRIGGAAAGPVALMQMVNEIGRGIRQGGTRRAAIWAGLNWRHQDIMKFILCKNWPDEQRALKEKNLDYPLPMELTNISVLLDDDFFAAYARGDEWATMVYKTTVKRMLKTAEPGFSIDVGKNAGETLRNACTEITSADDSDICNLGSVNIARIESPAEMRWVVGLATAFLLHGTVYSDLPYAKVAEIRTKNRRLGLGLMGLHEWLLKHGHQYSMQPALKPYLEEYSDATVYAKQWADMYGLSLPVKTRAIAPTGTIGIVGETTTGIEPIYCVAYKRRYFDGNSRRYQYVLDPTAKRLAEKGIDPNRIEDAMTLAGDVERRLAFQVGVQKYVDHAISSTINLPAWGSELNNEDTLAKYEALFMKYLPELRGLTVYPDGARGGQPLSRVEWLDAIARHGKVYEEDVCELRGGESCGA